MNAASLARYEGAMWRSLFAWIGRRPRSRHPDESLFGYDRAQGPLLWAFIALNFIEIPAVHFLIPWTWARIVLLIAGVWGTIWMVGILAAVKVNPHLVGSNGIRVRNGFLVDIPIGWDKIAAVSGGVQGSTGTRTVQLDGQRVGVVVTGQTNVSIRLTEPTILELPKGPAEVTEIRCFADDSAAMVSACRGRLAQLGR